MKFSAQFSSGRTRVILLLALAMLGVNLSAAAQQPAPAQAVAPQPPQPAAAAPASPQEQSDSAEALHVMVGRSLVITSPARLTRVSIVDPSIADAVIVSPMQIQVNGKSPGVVSMVLWDDSGQSQTFEVNVELDVQPLQRKLRNEFPKEAVTVGAAKDVVTLSGNVSSQAVADKILEFAKATTPKVVSLMQVPEPPPGAEILLQVKFAEVDRSTLNQLGINLFSTGGKFIASSSTQQFGPPSIANSNGSSNSSSGTAGRFQVSDLLNVFIFRPDIDFATTIKALEQKNVLQILAEPNVLTESGKEGSFLAGGEFPVPIAQPGGSGNAAVITIQWKQFGVQLNFAPTLAADGLIHLKVRPEVSTLDYANAVAVSGFLVPALSTRRVESEMELQDGQSFAIAGLVDNRVTKVLSKIPGIGDIPVLGKLFQSRSFDKSRTELLVIVTPRVVKPSPPAALPALPQNPIPFLAPTPTKAGQ